ncbi:MAG: alpha/beta fold hydrolase, partial [Acidimicrobiales bacterium]
MTVTEHVIEGFGGVQLAVREHGDATHGPTVVLVHGYPDNQRVWDLVAVRLATDHHVVTYDVRGAGRSSAPTDKASYKIDALIADLVAIVDAAAPDRNVHLVGHDWGSIQSWAAVTDPVAQRRIASFTSISGPSLDHAGRWIKAHRRPGKHRWRRLARQAAHSWYVYAFHTPLAAVAWRRGLARMWPEIVAR